MKKLFFALIPLLYLITLLFQTDLAMMGDLGRHLKLGEIVTQCHCIPQTNLFSYTNPDFPIVNHEWLGEVIYYSVAKTFGLSGLLIFKMILVITSAVLLYLVARKKGSLFWVTIFSLLGITMFSMRFFVLPELFSYLMISVFIFLIDRYQTTKKLTFLWILPILELMWVNMHLYFILGISIFGFFVLENVANTVSSRRKQGGEIPSFPKRFLTSFEMTRILIIGLLLIVATLFNPSGLKGALLPFTFSQNYGFPVEENKSPLVILEPSSTTANIAYTLVMQVSLFEILAVLFAIGIFFTSSWKNLSSFGNGLTGLILGLKYTRCISLFGLLGFIPFVQFFTMLEKKFERTMEEPMKNILKTTIALIVGLIVLFHIKGLTDYKILHFGFEPSAEKAATFVRDNKIEGRIFNNYIIGNYLIYALYPEQVYIDARPEAYPSEFFNEYWMMLDNGDFFNKKADEYGINVVVFNVAIEDPNKTRPFLTRLLQSPDWVPVYGDGIVTIVVKNNEKNRTVISKYGISLQK